MCRTGAPDVWPALELSRFVEAIGGTEVPVHHRNALLRATLGERNAAGWAHDRNAKSTST